MKNRNKKIISVLLAAALCFTGLPGIAAYGEYELPEAESADDNVPSEEASGLSGEGESVEPETGAEILEEAGDGEEGLQANGNEKDIAEPDEEIADGAGILLEEEPAEYDIIDEDVLEEEAYLEAEDGDAEEISHDDISAAMPSGERSGTTAGGISVAASYGAGVFPEGAEMVVTDISKDEAIANASEVLDNVVDAAGVDISFYDADGEELQPQGGGEVLVSMSLRSPLNGSGGLSVVHTGDDGETTELAASDIAEISTEGAEFLAESFSTYTVVATGGMLTITESDDGTEVVVNVPQEVTSLDYMANNFTDKTSVVSISITGDTSNVTDLHGMFYGCSSLTTLDLRGLDTSGVTSMGQMFADCNSLTMLDLSGFDTSSVTNMNYMFYRCRNLTSLNMGGWDTSSVTNMSNMFLECGSLTTLDLSGFDTSSVTNMFNMFWGCTGLGKLDLSSFDMVNVSNVGTEFLSASQTLEEVRTPKNLAERIALFADYYVEGSPEITYNHFPTSNEVGADTSLTLIRVGSATGVSLDPTELTLAVGEEETLVATVSPDDATNKNVTWNSSDESVATVDSGGKVTAVSAGTATITVTTTSRGLTATCEVTVTAPTVSVTGVSLNKNTLALTVGDEETLVATVAPADATDKSVTWGVGNGVVVTVDSGGKVTAVSAGTATVTVTTTDGRFTDTCEVTVTAATIPTTGVTLDKSELTMYVGDEETLTATVAPDNATDRSVSWSTDDGTVATVDGGTVRAVKAGTATITVTTADGRNTATCAVTVLPIAVTGVTLNHAALSMITGSTNSSLVATVAPGNATNKGVSWTSSDTGIVTVDSSGMLLAVSAGTSTVTVTTADGGHTATCAVTVTDEVVDVTGITVSPSTLSLNKGGSGTLTATVTPANATNRNITWTSSDMRVATVDQTGTVTAVKAGTATVTATTADGGYSDACEVTVTGYSIEIVDNRANPEADRITAGIRNMNGDRYLVIEDSDGSTLKGLIASDSSLSYTSAYFCDISLTDARENGNAVTDFGSCLIRMPMPEGMSVSGGTVRVVSVLDGELDKSILCQPVAIDGTDYVQFSTAHFSPFAFLYAAGNSNASPTVVTDTVYRYISGGSSGSNSSGGSGTVYVYRGSSSSDDDDDDDGDETEETGPKVTKVVWQESEKSTFYWKYGEKADGYRVQWSTSPKFKKSKTKTVTSGKKSKAVKGMKVGKKYYVRVRAFEKSGKEKVMGKWGHRVIVKRKR